MAQTERQYERNKPTSVVFPRDRYKSFHSNTSNVPGQNSLGRCHCRIAGKLQRDQWDVNCKRACLGISKELKLYREQPVTGLSWRANRESVAQSSRYPCRDTLDGRDRAIQRPRDKDGPLPEILRFEHPQRAGVSDPDRR